LLIISTEKFLALTGVPFAIGKPLTPASEQH
jgi:hypothetical protein